MFMRAWVYIVDPLLSAFLCCLLLGSFSFLYAPSKLARVHFVYARYSELKRDPLPSFVPIFFCTDRADGRKRR
ncbi:hypothetical protein BKA57DRAFT_457283 [Linnemannia elongata]|nr:hypothetical protein BKA57DRAFT_457283 [Linnemannia elongata]